MFEQLEVKLNEGLSPTESEITTDLDKTIALLQQDFTLIPIEEVVAMIENWQHQLQDTDFFNDLSELKQAILSVRTTAISKLLINLGGDTTAIAADAPGSLTPKLQQLGALLTQAGNLLM
jgi:hypothetical protein